MRICRISNRDFLLASGLYRIYGFSLLQASLGMLLQSVVLRAES